MHHLYKSVALEEGSIIKLMRFQTIYFNYDCATGSKPTNLIVLSLDLKVIGKKDKLFSDDVLKIKRLAIRKVVSMSIRNILSPMSPIPPPAIDMGLPPLTQATKCDSSIDSVDLTAPANVVVDTSTCTGNLFSIYGISFIQCVCITHPIGQLSLGDISSECHFLGGKCWKTMENKSKRLG